jgi:hypothetical protein
MDTLFYIKEDGKGKATVVALDTGMPVTVDMEVEDAAKFLNKMLTIKRRSLKPSEPRLFYNRAEH